MANERTWFGGFESAFHDVDGVRRTRPRRAGRASPGAGPCAARDAPVPLPERLIGADPRFCFYLHASLGGWGSQGLDHIEPQALSDYERCFGVPETIHAACEDYRASSGIDLEHDRASRAGG